jgi:hypothetical protein
MKSAALNSKATSSTYIGVIYISGPQAASLSALDLFMLQGFLNSEEKQEPCPGNNI